jgi:hypothetical protein
MKSGLVKLGLDAGIGLVKSAGLAMDAGVWLGMASPPETVHPGSSTNDSTAKKSFFITADFGIPSAEIRNIA